MMRRTFQVVCDTCGTAHPALKPYSEDAKALARKDGWVVYNEATCPECQCTCSECKIHGGKK